MFRYTLIGASLLFGACLGSNCPPILRPSLRVFIVDSMGEPVSVDAVQFSEVDYRELRPCTNQGDRWACGQELPGTFLVRAEVDGRIYEAEATVSENDCGIVTEDVEIVVDP